MGIYINPTNGMSGHNWIKGHVGIQIEVPKIEDVQTYFDEGVVLICAVNNGAFYAFAVVYSINEFKAFTSPTDNRPKDWFKIPVDAFSPEFGSGISESEYERILKYVKSE